MPPFPPCQHRVLHKVEGIRCRCKKEIPYCSLLDKPVSPQTCKECKEIEVPISPKDLRSLGHGYYGTVVTAGSYPIYTSDGVVVTVKCNEGDWIISTPSQTQFVLTNAAYQRRFKPE